MRYWTANRLGTVTIAPGIYVKFRELWPDMHFLDTEADFTEYDIASFEKAFPDVIEEVPEVVQATDDNGKPKKDKDGAPVMTTVMRKKVVKTWKDVVHEKLRLYGQGYGLNAGDPPVKPVDPTLGYTSEELDMIAKLREDQHKKGIIPNWSPRRQTVKTGAVTT